MSIGLALALLAMISAALALLLVPLLWHRPGSAARDAYNLAVYRDQLGEIERDIGRGLLTGEQAEAARAEIGRRILALKPAQVEVAAPSNAPAIATLAVLLLPIAALLLYWHLGSPAMPDEPFAARREAASPALAGEAAHIEINQAIARLAASLKTHPEDLAGWLLLARSEMSIGQYRQAADAYARAADLSGHRADIEGDRGEALVLAAGGAVTPAARQAFETALKDPEGAPRARYYLALAQMQQGDVAGALQAWRALAADAPKDAAWLPLVRRRIAEADANLADKPAGPDQTAPPSAAAEPSAAAVAATAKAMSSATPAERQAMIDAMVAQLAARLQQHPDDAEGWARLGRAYMVLGRPDQARDAYARAVKLKPDDAALKQALVDTGSAAGEKPAEATASPPGPR